MYFFPLNCQTSLTNRQNPPFQEDEGHLKVVLCLLQPQVDSNDKLVTSDPPAARRPPAWCRCGRCTASSLPQEELCCRWSEGVCITSSPLFESLMLRRPLLEAVLLYREPLSSPGSRNQNSALRHCAYRQYVSWRFGAPPSDAHPVVPRCCVVRIREEFPSTDGRYSGFRPAATASMQACDKQEVQQE